MPTEDGGEGRMSTDAQSAGGCEPGGRDDGQVDEQVTAARTV